MELVEFLRARLDEDEAAARAASPGPWIVRQVHNAAPIIEGGPGGYDEVVWPGEVKCGSYCYGGTSTLVLADEDAAHIARHDPARVLAEVAAKRAIVDLHVPVHPDVTPTCQHIPRCEDETSWLCSECNTWDDELPCRTLRHLATVYAEHPDYREEWRP